MILTAEILYLNVWPSFSFLKKHQEVIQKINSREQDPINQARLRMLVFGLAMNQIFSAISTVIYLISGPPLQFYRSIIVFCVGAILLFVIKKWNVWRQVSHTLVSLLTILIWSNLLIFVQGINIPTIQFVFIIIVYVFYVHGLRWGLFYGLANIVPVLAYTLLDGRDYFNFDIQPQKINLPAYVFVVAYNFGLILFLHYHFFKAFINNIGKLTKAGQELKLLNEQLKHSIQEVEKASRVKMDFLSTMSHELRTPLNGVIGLSNVLLMNEPREDQKENMQILKFSAENLLALINDILDYNKLNSGKLQIEAIAFSLKELLENICGGLRLRTDEKGIQLNLIMDQELSDKAVIGDPTRLTQVLVNLINNAIKFTSKGSVTVRVKISDYNEHSLKVNFAVIDTGIGIPLNRQNSIFEPFTQASESTSRKFGGTGLGLSIVKNILEKQGSKIHLISQPNEGTEFYFSIRFDYTTVKETKKQNVVNYELETGFNGLRVLLAEDNPINVMVIKKLFSLWNLDSLTVAQNGSDALKMVESNSYDVALMDLHMPEMDGYEATRKIRSLEDRTKSSVYIIALTASSSEDVSVKVKDAGMNDYIPKPFNPKELHEKLRNICLNKEAEVSNTLD